MRFGTAKTLTSGSDLTPPNSLTISNGAEMPVKACVSGIDQVAKLPSIVPINDFAESIPNFGETK